MLSYVMWWGSCTVYKIYGDQFGHLVASLDCFRHITDIQVLHNMGNTRLELTVRKVHHFGLLIILFCLCIILMVSLSTWQ